MFVIVIRKKIEMLRHSEKTVAIFDKKKQCFKILKNFYHCNIIELLELYTHRNQHNFIFFVLFMNFIKFLNCETKFKSF